MLINFLFLTAFQQIDRNRMLNTYYSELKGNSEIDINLLLHPKEYGFSLLTKNTIKGWHQAELLTDLPCKFDFCKTRQQILAYYLYPNVSFRFNNKTPKDTKIFFFVEYPEKSITEKNEILVNIDNKLILTIDK